MTAQENVKVIAAALDAAVPWPDVTREEIRAVAENGLRPDNLPRRLASFGFKGPHLMKLVGPGESNFERRVLLYHSDIVETKDLLAPRITMWPCEWFEDIYRKEWERIKDAG